MKQRIIGSIILTVAILSFSISTANAQVYSEQVDMLCPDFLLGSYFDFSETRDWIHICPINEPEGNGGCVGSGCDTPVTTCPDIDGDGITCDDLCPDEPETVNFFEDFDGCPDENPEPEPEQFLLLFEAFGNVVTSLPNTFVPDQHILIQWNRGDDALITSVNLSPNPFEFDFEPFPALKAGSGLPLSQSRVNYELLIPNLCGSVVTNECVQLLRYEIPTTVRGIINGTTVEDATNIIVDLRDEEFDVTMLLLLLLLLIPILGLLVKRRKKKKKNPSRRSQLD